MSLNTQQQSTILLTEPDLNEQLKTLFEGICYDGITIKLNDSVIKEEELMNLLQDRYENPNENNLSLEGYIEPVLPFTETFNEKRFWLIEKNEDILNKIHLENGQQLVSQDGQSMIVNAGEYLNGGFLIDEKNEGENNDKYNKFVYLFRNKKIDRPEETNYYVNVEGDFAVKIFNKPMIRFYFHLLPKKEKILEWAKYIQDNLNKYRIPFQLKYPFNLNNYEKSDGGVLYVSQNHFPLVAPLINQIAIKYKELLHAKVPLFVRKLYDGIGFAEDPFFSDDSFGTHRRKMIWEDIVKRLVTPTTYCAALDSDKFVSKIIEQLNGLGYSKGLYRNSFTDFSYNFEKHIRVVYVPIVALLPKSSFKTTLESLTNYFVKVKAQYTDLIDDFGRMRFQEVAENYGKDLVEKAIWNAETDTYYWLTYDQDENDNHFYRTTDEEELFVLKLFLSLLSEDTNDDYYKKVADKIILEHGNNSPINTNKEVKTALNAIFSHLNENKDSERVLEIIDEIGRSIGDLKNPAKLGKEDIQKLAKVIDKFFEKFGLPIKNSFGNYEYCPNYNGKLKIAFLFLIASRARNIEELLTFYNLFYNSNREKAKAKYEEWKNQVLLSPLFSAANIE